MNDVPLLHELIGESVAAQRMAERHAAEMEERHNKSVKQTVSLINALKDGTIQLDDVETSETGWSVKRAD